MSYNPKVLIVHHLVRLFSFHGFGSTVRCAVNGWETANLVVDDHAEMREGISAVVNAQQDMMVVGEARDGQEALERFRSLQPDVSLLDWNRKIRRIHD
jgi:hypothetical protein